MGRNGSGDTCGGRGSSYGTFGHLRDGNGYFRVNVENHRISTGHLFFTIYAEA